MTPDDRITERLGAGLVGLAGTSAPDYRDDILRQVARTRQRPAWTFAERWIPMTLIAHRAALAPLAHRAWLLLAVPTLTAALVAGLVIAGGQMLRPRLDDSFNVLVPVFTHEDPWDAQDIDGLSHPSDIDVGPDGDLYVVNGSNEVLVLDPDGNVLDRWGSLGTGPGQFSLRWDPADSSTTTGGVAIAPDGSVYVTDLNNRRVQRFARGTDSRYAFVQEWGSFGTGPGQFLRPYDVAVDPAGRVYVADFGRSDVQRFTPDGQYLDSAGGWGSGDGRLTDPTGITLTADDELLVADYTPGRIEAWDPDLRFAWSHDATAQDLAMGADDHLYLTDTAGLTVLGPDREELGSWVFSGSSPDDWHQVAVSPAGVAYVTSAMGSRIDRAAIEWVEDYASSAPSITPVPSAGPSASPGPSPAPSQPPTSVLTVGEPFAIPFTLDVPPGWSVSDIRRGGAQVAFAYGSDSTPVWLEVHIPTNVFADPCRSNDGPLSPPVGLTVDELTEALTHLAGYRAGPVSDVVIDGHPGKAFDLDDAVDINACDGDPWLHQWTFDGSRTGASFDLANDDLANAHQRIAVLDVNGTSVLVWTFYPDVRADWVHAASAVMASIDFQ